MSQNEQQLWSYSLNDEDYNSGTFASSTDALEAGVQELQEVGRENEPGAVIYVAKAVPQKNSTFFPDADHIIEHMSERACDTAGDYASDYPDVSDEAKEELDVELNALLERWCAKHKILPEFFLASEAVKYDALTLKPVPNEEAAGT